MDIMGIKEIKIEGLAREMQVTVPMAEMTARLNTRIDKMKGQMQLKGFRPGKVPSAHIRKTFGSRLMGEIIQETVTETSQQMLTERDERPAMQPEIKLIDDADKVIAGQADLVYDISFEIVPDIELIDFGKLELTRPVVEIDEVRIDEALERLASSRKEFSVRDKVAKAHDGDRVKIDFIGRIKGEVFDGGTAEGFDLELGSNQFIPGFEDQLIGSKAGDKISVDATFPESYSNAELAGKPAIFEVNVHEVSEPKEVAINEEFATSMGMENLGKLKDTLREQISSDYSQRSRGHMKKDLFDALVESHEFELPPSMVELEFNQLWQQFERDLETQEKTFDDLDKSEDELQAEHRGIAERRVRTGLVLAEIGSKNEINVSQEELNQGLIQRAQKFPGQEQQVFEYFQKNPDAMAQIRAPVFEEKVIDFICEMAAVADKTVSLDELMRDAGAEPDAEPKDQLKKKSTKKASAKKSTTNKSAATKPATRKAAAKKPTVRKG